MPVKTSTLPAHLPNSESSSLSTDAPEASFALETKDCPDTTAPDRRDCQPLEQIKQSSIWGVFASTFATIFLAEMGDKTQIATLLMTAESHSPWIVFLGAGSALIATSLLGVLLGCWLAGRLSPKILETAAGIILLFISASLLWDILH